VDRIKKIRREHDPDLLFIEPSEMVVTQELRTVAAMAGRDIRVELGPLITLVDGPRFPQLWQERRQLLLGQIDDADIVAVSRGDRIGPADVTRIQSELDGLFGEWMLLHREDADAIASIAGKVTGIAITR
jgi:G3E family GTPase